MMTQGEKLREIKICKGFTQDYIASSVGVSTYRNV